MLFIFERGMAMTGQSGIREFMSTSGIAGRPVDEREHNGSF
jgi:hypothetical protein